MIHSSSVMEGSTLSIHDTEMLITQDITPEGKPLEHSVMTNDLYAALLKVNELATDTKLKFPHARLEKRVRFLPVLGTSTIASELSESDR